MPRAERSSCAERNISRKVGGDGAERERKDCSMP